MTTQPEALRRLQKENEYIRSALKGWTKENSPGGWIGDLRAQRDALLEALKKMRNKYGEYACSVCDQADAAIKAAEETK